MFTKSCEYAIKAVIYIANQSLDNKRVKLHDIVKHVESPPAFTAKILQELAKNQIIVSQTGPNGGFEISKSDMKEIRLSEIVRVIDGDSIYKGCGLGLSQCSESKPCPIHKKFAKVRNELRKMLDSTTIYELAVGIKTTTYLKR
jgi:Rrf2 family protein